MVAIAMTTIRVEVRIKLTMIDHFLAMVNIVTETTRPLLVLRSTNCRPNLIIAMATTCKMENETIAKVHLMLLESTFSITMGTIAIATRPTDPVRTSTVITEMETTPLIAIATTN